MADDDKRDDEVFVPDPDPAPDPAPAPPPSRAQRSDHRRDDEDDDRDDRRRRDDRDRDDRYRDRDDEYDRRRPPRKYDEEGNELTSDDTMWGMFAHLGLFLLGFLAPLIIFFIYKDKSPFVTRHAKAALNHTITYILLMFSWMLVAGLIGYVVYLASSEPLAGFFTGYILFFLGWMTMYVCHIVFIIIATVAASKGKYYRYPLTISFIG